MIKAIRSFLHKKASAADSPAAAAYDIWANTYDNQPGNLVLDLDKQLFAGLIKNICLENKKIADVGCGTGRHWPLLYAPNPALVMGFDVSEGMLQQLRQKFPNSIAQQITGDQLEMVPDRFVDCLISTLTIGHIKNIAPAIAAWTRIMKNGADLIITDFHPAILASGGKRSFHHQGKNISVKNYVHSLEEVTNVLRLNGLILISKQEKFIDKEVRHYYAAKNALPVYERFKNMPVIYGLHLKKANAPA
jgi:ubiquinone/menaquinone biosynthesis C-methylase UbiE